MVNVMFIMAKKYLFDPSSRNTPWYYYWITPYLMANITIENK